MLASIISRLLQLAEADDYVCNLSGSASLRAMILSRVVVGKPYKRYRNAPDLVSPPFGYDSVGEQYTTRLSI